MANLTSMIDHIAKLPRSGFDMSQSLMFSAAPGMILPVYSDFLNSSEKVTITTDLFARTQPLVTAAMADVDIYLDWFFVPMTMLFTPWGQVRWQTNDFLSSKFISNITDLSDETGSYVPLGGSGQGTGGFPLMDSISFGFGNTSNPLTNYNLLQPFSPSQSGLYGWSVQPSTSQVYLYPNGFEVVGKSMFRMMDLLGYNPYGIFQFDSSYEGSQPTKNPNVFPWRALAYQCIYQNYYRNDDFELRDVLSYNWDAFAGMTSPVAFNNLDPETGSGPSRSVVYNPHHPFILRYCEYRRDYFTSSRPSPIMSSLNGIASSNVTGGFGSSQAYNVLRQVLNYLQPVSASNIKANPYASTNAYRDGNYSTAVGNNITSAQNLTIDTTTGLGTNNFELSGAVQFATNTANLRSLFAVEKLLRVSGRAAKDYDSQTLAHFGFKVPHDVKHQITHLHSSHGMLHVGEVISTSDTVSSSGGSALGEIAGKGYVSINDKKKIRFTAPVDGALMCTFRAVPRLRVTDAFDRQNAITNRLDLFIPEFDKLGAQPLYRYEYSYNGIGASDFIFWQNRYQQYKRKYDRASVVFSGSPTSGINQYSSWVLSYNPFSTLASNPSDGAIRAGIALKCPPTAMNNIMSVPYQPTVSSSFNQNPIPEYYTDPFLCDFRANVKKVSPMSPTGEPDMISL